MEQSFTTREEPFAEGVDAPEHRVEPPPAEPNASARPGPAEGEPALLPQSSEMDPTLLRLSLRERGYDPVPTVGKRPVMRNWQRECRDASPKTIERWASSHQDHTNTGLLCRTLLGVDIDVLQPELAGAISQLAIELLGHTSLRRIGLAPKVLLVYRVAIPTTKLQTPALYFTDDPAEKPTKVEVLADGQQFVAFGCLHGGGSLGAVDSQPPDRECLHLGRLGRLKEERHAGERRARELARRRGLVPAERHGWAERKAAVHQHQERRITQHLPRQQRHILKHFAAWVRERETAMRNAMRRPGAPITEGGLGV